MVYVNVLRDFIRKINNVYLVPQNKGKILKNVITRTV